MPPRTSTRAAQRHPQPKTGLWLGGAIALLFVATIATVVTIAVVKKTKSGGQPAPAAPVIVDEHGSDNGYEPDAEIDEPTNTGSSTHAATAGPPSEAPSGSVFGAPPPPPAIAGYARSPLAQPGENIRKPISMRRLDDGGPPPDDVGQVVPWNRAHYHVGKTATIEGQVVATRNTGQVCFLNFDEDWQGKFYIILFNDVMDAWPMPPEVYFRNKKIHVTGEVKLRGTTPQIQVRRADQINIVP